jgi:hypothetical protein
VQAADEGAAGEESDQYSEGGSDSESSDEDLDNKELKQLRN